MTYRCIMSMAAAMTASTTQAADTPDLAREQAFQDPIAYVATFAMPVLIEKCAATDAAYLARAAPAYFRYVDGHQDQIERGRLLTLAGFGPDETPSAYRTRTLAQPTARHLRPVASRGGILRGRARLGRAAFILRYSPWWVAAKSAQVALKRPYLLGGVAYFCGYLRAAAADRHDRVEDPEFARFVAAELRGRARGRGIAKVSPGGRRS